MPILEVKNEHELIITHECNWNCPYCSENICERDPLDLEDVFRKIDLIPNGVPVTLSGGEPGMMLENSILLIINKLKEKRCELMLNTNGLFIENYPHLLNHFSYILYHCSENLDEEIKIYDYENVHHALVLTDENVYKLSKVLYNYPIKWNIIPASNPEPSDKPVLTYANRMMILKKHHLQLTEHSKIRLIREKKWNEIVFL